MPIKTGAIEAYEHIPEKLKGGALHKLKHGGKVPSKNKTKHRGRISKVDASYGAGL